MVFLLLGLGAGAAGIMPMKQGVAAFVAIYLFGLMLHVNWRYKPLNQASRLIDEGKFPAARHVLEAYLQKPVHRGGRARQKAMLLYAHTLWYLGEAETAVTHCERLLEETRDHGLIVLLHNLLVSCHVQMRKTLKVNALMGNLLKLDGLTAQERWESLISVGICAMNEEMFHEAIDFLQQATAACEDEPRRAYVFGMLAACHNRVKDYVKALGAIQDARKLPHDDPLTKAVLLDNFAFAKANLKQDLEEALAAANEGLALNLPPALPHLYTSRGEVHYALRNFDAAMADLEQAISRLPDRDRNARQKAWFIKGKIHKARGEDDLAKEALSNAISIDSSKTIAMNAQAVLASPEGLKTLIQSGDVKLEGT